MCRWHIRKNWKKRLLRFKDSYHKNYWLLEKLIKSPTSDEFKSNLRIIKKDFPDELYEYLRKYYLSRTEKWAQYKIDCPNAYNLHIESFHKVLKKNHFNYKRNRRVDRLIHTLLEFDAEKSFEQKVNKIRHNYSSSTKKIHKYHHQARNSNHTISTSNGSQFSCKVILLIIILFLCP